VKKIFSRKLLKALLVIAIFGLIVFLNPGNFFSPIRSLWSRATYPLVKISSGLALQISGAKNFAVSIGDLKNENKELISENQQLQAENARLRDVQQENDFLRQQLNLVPREKFDLEGAFVIARDSQGLGNWLEIDKGSEAGIEEGMAVVVSKGILIGKIQEVFAGRSRIILLSNPQNTISIIVSQSGAKGVIKGEYGLGIIADSILQTDSVVVGDEIVTAGISGKIPRGLLVGTVQQVRSSSDHLFQQAVVSSPIDISKIEAVFVVKSEKTN